MICHLSKKNLKDPADTLKHKAFLAVIITGIVGFVTFRWFMNSINKLYKN